MKKNLTDKEEKEKTAFVTLRINKGLYKKIKHRALDEDITMTQFFINAARKYLEI